MPPRESDDKLDSTLKGTTYRVYRYMVKQRNPVGISEIKEALTLSSSSVSEYHVKKLLRLGLIRAEQGGYVVDRVVVDNIVRIRRIAIPIHVAYVAFFSVTLVTMLLVLRPTIIEAVYFLGLMVNATALGISVFETVRTLRRF
jgi:predicted DNA-binding transcriptional regulator